MDRFAKIIDNGTELEYSLGFYKDGGVLITAPSEEIHNAHGYYRIANNPQPEHGEDEIAVGGHYIYADDDDGKRVIKTDWRIEAKPVDRADYDAAMEAHLRAEREARGYTDREPTDYMASGVARWKQDAIDWADHRDAVMLYGLEIINRFVETGEAPTLAEFKAGLPTISWTEA